MEHGSSVETEALNMDKIPRIYLGRISGENLLIKGLVKPVREFTKLITETNSKM